MTQGIFVNYRRPKSKAEVKKAVVLAEQVTLEATSIFGNEYDGSVYDAPDGTYTFVGPDPFTKRTFFGQVIVRNGKVTIK